MGFSEEHYYPKATLNPAGWLARAARISVLVVLACAACIGWPGWWLLRSWAKRHAWASPADYRRRLRFARQLDPIAPTWLDLRRVARDYARAAQSAEPVMWGPAAVWGVVFLVLLLVASWPVAFVGALLIHWYVDITTVLLAGELVLFGGFVLARSALRVGRYRSGDITYLLFLAFATAALVLLIAAVLQGEGAVSSRRLFGPRSPLLLGGLSMLTAAYSLLIAYAYARSPATALRRYLVREQQDEAYCCLLLDMLQRGTPGRRALNNACEIVEIERPRKLYMYDPELDRETRVDGWQIAKALLDLHRRASWGSPSDTVAHRSGIVDSIGWIQMDAWNRVPRWPDRPTQWDSLRRVIHSYAVVGIPLIWAASSLVWISLPNAGRAALARNITAASAPTVILSIIGVVLAAVTHLVRTQGK